MRTRPGRLSIQFDCCLWRRTGEVGRTAPGDACALRGSVSHSHSAAQAQRAAAAGDRMPPGVHYRGGRRPDPQTRNGNRSVGDVGREHAGRVRRGLLPAVGTLCAASSLSFPTPAAAAAPPEVNGRPTRAQRGRGSGGTPREQGGRVREWVLRGAYAPFPLFPGGSPQTPVLAALELAGRFADTGDKEPRDQNTRRS